MFGIVVCEKNQLSEDEKKRYQATYCGVCRALRDRYGQTERMTLNYDTTFLAMMLNGLYEENSEYVKIHCMAHPIRKNRASQNQYVDYAADMTVLLAYYKCLDDWEDEKKHLSKRFGDHLEQYKKDLEEKYPRQCTCVRMNLQKLSEIEQTKGADAKQAIYYAGEMLTELFVYREDHWSNDLRSFGYEMGRFIYLMDAALDYDKDLKKGTYNPLQQMGITPIEAEADLKKLIGNAAYIFEDLPIISDANIMRNILYSGVWQQYDMRIKGKELREKNNGK